MAENTKIEWTDATWTPIRARNKVTGKVGWHCEHASHGCVNCYSGAFNENRLGTGLTFKPGHRDHVEHFLDERMLLAPLRWRKPRRIFVCSMTDLFGAWVPDAWIDRVFAVMALAPQHTFQVLTKRSARMRAYLADNGMALRVQDVVDTMEPDGLHRFEDHEPWIVNNFPLPNVWLGVSAEDQKRADERVPDLLATPAAVRFVSAEPLLGPINFSTAPAWCYRLSEPRHRAGWMCPLTGDHQLSPVHADHRGARLDWIIVGGESGPGARPMHPDWARSIRDQCAAAGVAFFMKQMSGTSKARMPAIPADLLVREMPNAA